MSCNKEPLRGHDSTQDLAASIETEAMLNKVHHHHHHEHDHDHDRDDDDDDHHQDSDHHDDDDHVHDDDDDVP